MENDRILEIIRLLIEDVTAKTFLHITKTMDKDEIEKLEKFLDAKPNEVQQYIVLNKFYKKKTGKEIEDLQNELLEEGLDNIEKQMFNNENQVLLEKISKLSDDKAKEYTAMIKNGEYDKVMNLLNS